MKYYRAYALALTSLVALAAIAARANAPIMDSVTRNLEHAQICLDRGDMSEAQAYAETTTFLKPIRVYVKNDSLGVTTSATETWEHAMNGSISFVESTAGQADITIEFKPRVQSSGHDIMGLATTQRKVHAWFGGEFTSSVTGSLEIATVAPNGIPVSRDVMLNTTIHEIGHFLGLDDTYGEGRVMGPINLRNPQTAPSMDESNTLLAIQQQATLLAQSSVGSLARP